MCCRGDCREDCRGDCRGKEKHRLLFVYLHFDSIARFDDGVRMTEEVLRLIRILEEDHGSMVHSI